MEGRFGARIVMHNGNAAFIHCPELDAEHYPPQSPFRTTRAGMTRRILVSMGRFTGPGREERTPVPAGRDVLETFHTCEYLDAMIAAESGHLDVDALYMGIGTPDCPAFKGMYEFARLAVGATLTGARLILDHDVRVAFNPSGGFHHAGPERASGFCYVNDSALACLALAEAGRRVVYLDVDAHHGDGVQNAVYDRNDVMTISMHENGHTLFPGTGFEDEIGHGHGLGCAVNLPMPPQTYDEAYLKAFREVAVPLIGAFDPDVIVIELGMDSLAGDPLTHLALTNLAYVDIIERVMRFDKPVLAVGGGGYNVDNTARAWALAWTVLTGQDREDEAHAAGMGGVMLESTDWTGGLRDRVLVPDHAQRRRVAPAVDETIERVKQNVFGIHGLSIG